MDTIDHTNTRPRAVRLTAALVAALLALTAGLVGASSPPVGADPLPTGLTWKMSEQAWTSSSLAPAHTTAAPATKGADGFAFPTVEDVSVNAFTGAATATFPGSFDLGNTNQGNYRIRVADPTVTLPAGRATGTLTADVSYALWDGSAHVWTTPADLVVANLTFAPGTIVDTGSNLSFTVTPDFVLRTDLTPEANPNGFKQFPQPLLDLLAQSSPPLNGHFRQTATGQDAKAPSPLTVSFPYTAEAPPTGLTWRMSQQAWTSSSLAPANATAAPATKTDEGFSFPQASSAVYDPETGEGQIDFPGSFDLGNTNQGNYRIRIADPSLVLVGDGTGELTADVSYALFDGTTHVWTTPARLTVADLTLPEGAITVDGDQLSFIVTPDFVLRSDLTSEANPGQWKQFPQPLLDLLAQATPPLNGHFRQTADNQTAKAPSPLGVSVTFAEPDPDEIFVEAVYWAVLHRGPSEGEATYWVGRLDGGTSRDSVANAVAVSSEARRRLVGIGYSSALDRSPGAAEVDYWAGRLAAGLTPATLLSQLLASPEAWTVWGGTAEGLAEGAYQTYLDRAGDPDGIAYWGGRLAAADGAGGRRSVLGSFGRLAASTRAAIAEGLRNACGTVPALTIEQGAYLEHVWVTTGRNPLRLTAAVVARHCPEGSVVD